MSVDKRRVILAGDVGGTKTRLALVSFADGVRITIAEVELLSRNHASLEELIGKFMNGLESNISDSVRIDGACFGIAGPVIADEVETPNLPWIISALSLRQILDIQDVYLINDLEAMAHGIFILKPEDFLTLNEGSAKEQDNCALIAAGTGLGEAILAWEGKNYRPIASEGGHADFAPRNEIEIELLRYLLKKYDHVSYERVLSGPGLFNIYGFLKDTKRFQEPDWLRERIRKGDPAPIISQAALNGESDLCIQALDIFASVYGAEAGNLALKAKAFSGLYVGGGIAPKIADKLTDGAFLKSFASKGRLSRILESVPIKLIMNPTVGLYGAAYYAHARQRK